MDSRKQSAEPSPEPSPSIETPKDNHYFIEERLLRALLKSTEVHYVAFQRMTESTEGRHDYALIVTVPDEHEVERFVLCTSPDKAIRRFKNLEFCRHFIQKLKPDLKRFYTVIYPTLDELATEE